MRVTVIGQKGNGPVLKRTVTLIEFVEAWGQWAPILMHAHKTVEVEGCKVRVVVHA